MTGYNEELIVKPVITSANPTAIPINSNSSWNVTHTAHYLKALAWKTTCTDFRVITGYDADVTACCADIKSRHRQ